MGNALCISETDEYEATHRQKWEGEDCSVSSHLDPPVFVAGHEKDLPDVEKINLSWREDELASSTFCQLW
jgi:hypothetical protein